MLLVMQSTGSICRALYCLPVWSPCLGCCRSAVVMTCGRAQGQTDKLLICTQQFVSQQGIYYMLTFGNPYRLHRSVLCCDVYPAVHEYWCHDSELQDTSYADQHALQARGGMYALFCLGLTMP